MDGSGCPMPSGSGANAVDPDVLRFEPLTKHHDRRAFACGVESLDRYLKTQATQDARRYAAAPFVAVPGETDPTIVGFYTLAPTRIDVSAFPGDAATALPKYPIIPAILLGRLAVDRRFLKQGCGEALLMDAMARTLRHASRIGGAAMIVDAKDDAAVRFYQSYDFRRFPERRDRLFLPMTVIRKLFPEGS
jgi:GNAT superfamily N-acetyltransferase